MKLWDLMVEGGQKWSERLGVCDPRVRGALLFICMVAGLYWHFSNFLWLCKVFLQTFLHLANQFCNLKVIPKLGCDFAAISKLGDHFAEKWHVHRPFLKLGAFSQRGVDFVEEGNSRSPFRSLKVISQLIGDFAAISKLGDHFIAISKLKSDFAGVSQLQNEGNCAANGTRVPKSGFAAAKHPSKWRLGCEIPVQLCALVFKRP